MKKETNNKLIDTEIETVLLKIETELLQLVPKIAHKLRVELVRVLLGDEAIHVEEEPLTPDGVQEVLNDALDPLTAVRGIKQDKHGWRCAFCEMGFNTQRAASIHSRSCPQRPANQMKNQMKAQKAKPKTTRPARTCIKPGCDAPSKGPRFHHLCDKHAKAPKKNWQAWQKEDRETRAE